MKTAITDESHLMDMEINNLCKIYQSGKMGCFQALEGLSLKVASGEFVSIVGPSGCGKTTLIEIVAGLQEKTTGTILIQGNPIEKTSCNCAIVFQQYGLFPWMNVRKNVEYGPRIHGKKSGDVRNIAGKYIEMVGLEGFEKHYPHELSGGMQQRVALARAMANSPDILLLDEPFAALDAQTRETCQQELLNLWRQTGVTILFITHDIGEAVFLSDRVMVMTANPGAVKAGIHVELTRPRNTSVRMESHFHMIEANIRGMLNNGAGV